MIEDCINFPERIRYCETCCRDTVVFEVNRRLIELRRACLFAIMRDERSGVNLIDAVVESN